MSLIPGWVKMAAIAAVVLAILAGVATWRASLIEDGRQQERARWVERDRQQAEQAAKETQRRLDRQEESNRATQTALRAAEAGRRRADDAAGKLRDTYAAIAQRGCNPAPDAGGAPAGDPIGVLADVLGRADRRAGILAAYADAAHAAGAACEREHDALSPARP